MTPLLVRHSEKKLFLLPLLVFSFEFNSAEVSPALSGTSHSLDS